MANVVVNVQAQTGQATKEINNLDNALDNTNQSAEELNSSLEKQEARIKTLGGAINIVGGSVEVLAGGLAATSVLTEEQSEQFQSAAVGAIAFADGTKRIFEGAKELSEGLKASSTATKALTVVQRIYNTVLKANPVFVLVGVLAAVTAGVIALTRALSKQAEEQERLNALQERQERFLGTYDKMIKLAEIRKADEIEILKLQRGRIDAESRGNQKIIAELEARNSLNEEEQELLETTKERQKELANERIFNIARIRQAEKEDREEARAAREAELQAELDRYADILKENEDVIKEATELIVGGILEDILGGAKKAIEELPDLIIEEIDLEEIREDGELVGETFVTGFDLSFRQGLKETNAKLKDFYKSETASAISSNLEAASQLTSALVEVTGEGSEEAFERGKKFKIAEVVTSSIQAAFQAFGAAQQFGPILGPILGAAQVAAIGVAANSAIQDIRSSTFDGGSTTTPSLAGGGASGAAQTAGGILSSGRTANSGQPTPVYRDDAVRAYVLVNDVNSGQEAYANINRRRALNPG